MPAPDRNALLSSIQKGKPSESTGGPTSSRPSAGTGNAPSAPSGPQLGGLFAGGMPKLRSTGKLPAAEDSPKRPNPPAVSPSPARAAPRPTSTDTAREESPKKAANIFQQRPVRPPPVREEPTRSPVKAPPIPRPPTMARPTLRPTRRANSPDRTNHTSNVAVGRPPLPTSRPPLPARPQRQAEVMEKMQGLALEKRWEFRSEAQIPKPGKHSGRVFVYPSGRDQGCYVNETIEDSVIHSTSSTIRHFDSQFLGNGQTKQFIPQLSRAPTAPAANVPLQIKERLDSLEQDLAQYIEAQEFEKCVQLKPKISKLKSLLEKAERGVPVDPAEINSV